jgi:hypothetical protein
MIRPFRGIERIFRQLGTIDEVVWIGWSILTQTKGSYLHSERAGGWVIPALSTFHFLMVTGILLDTGRLQRG